MSAVTLWTSELSPFSLKIIACLEYMGVDYSCLPKKGQGLKSLTTAVKVEWAKSRDKVNKYPQMTPLDEYPGVPYLIQSDGAIQYDSSGISRWLDDTRGNQVEHNLWPKEPELAFVAQLIDDAMDDFGIYLAHHLRWVHSAATNDAGRRLHKEFGALLFWAGERKFEVNFSKRQVRRLPYLFSMPAANYQQSVPDYLKAPIESDWPETHTLLDTAWQEIMGALEQVLSVQPYLLGERFTIADASVYGMFGMLLDDPTAKADMLERAPITHQWLLDIKSGKHVNDRSDKPLTLSAALVPFVEVLCQYFAPLMAQNEAAYEKYKGQGETLFNEPAWRKRRSLYSGELQGHSFTSVVKTFQVQAWQDIKSSWCSLSDSEQESLQSRVGCLSEYF